MLAFLGWLKGQGIDSEVNTVTVSTPPRPKNYVAEEWGRISAIRVMTALADLGPSKASVVAAHLGWDAQRASNQLSRLGKRDLVLRRSRLVWELSPLGQQCLTGDRDGRLPGSSQGPASDLSGGEGEDAIGVGVVGDDDDEVGFELDDLGSGRVAVEPEPGGVGIVEMSPGEDIALRDGDGATA